MTRVVVRTPAKLNLALVVGPRRPDGFHDLACLYHAVDLFDEVTARPAAEISVRVQGVGQESVPLGRDNLAVRAAELLAERCGVTDGVELHLDKGIPVAAGLAGGSSDAAAALVACDALWRTSLSRTDLLDLAAQLGSDVPFCLLGANAVGSGHGEVVAPAPGQGRFSWVLAFDRQGLSTPQVYAELDRLRGGVEVTAPTVPDALLAALRDGDAPALGAALTNELQPAALQLRPDLGRVLRVGTEHGALGALVSGSGPTCMFLARDAEHAADLAARLDADAGCAGVRVAHGPVPGARRLPSPHDHQPSTRS